MAEGAISNQQCPLRLSGRQEASDRDKPAVRAGSREDSRRRWGLRPRHISLLLGSKSVAEHRLLNAQSVARRHP